MYWTLQEALANAARHSHATHAAVTLSVSDTEATLEVRDYGRGFVVPDRFTQLAADEHYGLTGLEQRAEILGGTLEIQSTLGQGTTLRVCLPLMPIVSSTLIVERSLEWSHDKPKC